MVGLTGFCFLRNVHGDLIFLRALAQSSTCFLYYSGAVSKEKAGAWCTYLRAKTAHVLTLD